MRKVIVFALSLGLCAGTLTPVKPISKTIVIGGTVVSAAAAGALGHFAMHLVEKYFPEYTTEKKKLLIKTIVTILAAGTGGLICYAILNSYTPKSRIKQARSLINGVERALGPRRAVSLRSIQSRYPRSDIPLVKEMEHQDNLFYKLVDAQELIQKACNEDPRELQHGQPLQARLNALFECPALVRNFILQNCGDEYRSQLTIDKERKQREKQIRLMEEGLRYKKQRDGERRMLARMGETSVGNRNHGD